MNRLILIGNGFDLAHGLKTSYKDFIYWYWDKRVDSFSGNITSVSEDCLCKLTVNDANTRCWNVFLFENSYFRDRQGDRTCSGYDVMKYIQNNPGRFSYNSSQFFGAILHSIETKKWVDIENEYYKLLEQYTLVQYSEDEITKLNKQLAYLQELLTEYLTEVNNQEIVKNKKIQDKIYAPIDCQDISVGARSIIDDFIIDCQTKDNKLWEKRLLDYDIIGNDKYSYLHKIEDYKKDPIEHPDIPRSYRLPESIMFLNFNYTKTADMYQKSADIFSQIHIHGALHNPAGMIFGYGDEFDDKYRRLQALNNNECLANIKTIKYQESDNYRRVLQFIESAPFQVYIMGHSCGNSDRTLLNTIFEHDNCISIKPFFYKKEDGSDSYIETIQNISRNFNDMKLMRDRVVNKMYCEALTE